MPTILCLHGHGSSAAIFSAQTHHLRAALPSTLRLIFLNAPFNSNPGPHILPCFADSGPYYTWFPPPWPSPNPRRRRRRNSISISISTALSSLNISLESGLKAQGLTPSDITGVLGFSQGAIVATFLLLQAQRGDPRWTNLRFGALICGAWGQEIVGPGAASVRVRGPSVHVHGLKDEMLDSARALWGVYEEERSVVLECEGGHCVPTAKGDVERLAEVLGKMSLGHVERRSG